MMAGGGFRLALGALAIAGLSGCVAIPMGSEEFSADYPGSIRAAAEPATKAYEPFAVAERAADSAGKVEIGLAGDVTVRQRQLQHYDRVSLSKKKRFAMGVIPQMAERVYARKDAMVAAEMAYCGGGRYGRDPPPDEPGAGEFLCGAWLNTLTLGMVSTPVRFLVELFGPFESGRHYRGRMLDSRKRNTMPTYDERDLDLLQKFPARDRKRIGVWTWRENDEHRHNTFCRGMFEAEWIGVWKYCQYIVHEPVETERTSEAPPRVTRERREALGPYGVFLQIPELGFAQTMGVPRGETRTRFNLVDVADGRKRVQGFIRFLPPSGGMAEVWDEDARAMLEAVAGKDFPMTLQMPPPRLGGRTVETASVPAAGGGEAQTGLYTIVGAQRTGTGGLRVRVKLADSAGVEEADRVVRPKIMGIFRDRIAKSTGGGRRTRVARRTEEGGRILVYSVEFEEGE